MEGDGGLTLTRIEERNLSDDREADSFLRQYQPSELQIAHEFLTTWLPFLSRDLCNDCSALLSFRIQSLQLSGAKSKLDSEIQEVRQDDSSLLTRSCNSEEPSISRDSASAQPRMSWADMAALEDELAFTENDDHGEDEVSKNTNLVDHVEDSMETGQSSSRLAGSSSVNREKPHLSRKEREYNRIMSIKRNKEFLCFERVDGKLVNVVKGLELHEGVFSISEQKKIVNFVCKLQEKGRNGELKGKTYSEPQKWMTGKRRVTIQFGCFYNYAFDKHGNPPEILPNEIVEPIPPLFKLIIKNLISWHVISPSCVPDSCIVNMYDVNDFMPPHIDNHDFLRPICTVSFLSECNIMFGTNIRILGAGEYDTPISIPMPVGSVLILNENAADIAKHCVPSVSSKRISITFRKMDENKRPVFYTPEPDLQDLQPLFYESEQRKKEESPKSEERFRGQGNRKAGRGDFYSGSRYRYRGRRGNS